MIDCIGERMHTSADGITYDYSWEGLIFFKFTYDYSWEGVKFVKFTYDYS